MQGFKIVPIVLEHSDVEQCQTDIRKEKLRQGLFYA